MQMKDMILPDRPRIIIRDEDRCIDFITTLRLNGVNDTSRPICALLYSNELNAIRLNPVRDGRTIFSHDGADALIAI